MPTIFDGQEGSPAPALYPPTVPVYGAPADFLWPADSCLVTPNQPDCPVITAVYYQETSTPAPRLDPVADATELSQALTSYVPNPSATYGGLTDKDYGACSAHALMTVNGSEATAHGYQECPNSVRNQEISVNVQRFHSNTGWTNLANGRQSRSGGGVLSREVMYNCNHSNVYSYRNRTFAYHTTQSGRAYSTSVTSKQIAASCNSR